MIHKKKIYASAIVLGTALISNTAFADCSSLPKRNDVQAALVWAQQHGDQNGGLGNNMWATVVDRSGMVCVVVYSGNNVGDQWLGSRVISAQKANTANAFSLPAGVAGTPIALSTANLYTATQPGGTLFGLQESNPVNATIAYSGVYANFGTAGGDVLVARRIGGINVFGGGLALYNAAGTFVGAIGVSGDTSCADHNIAWRTRWYLGLDKVPGGISAHNDDNVVYDISGGVSASGWGHPSCSSGATTIAQAFKSAGTAPKSATNLEP